ncbi:MAG: right-handed parallel beta-helix repeat-containing protein [Longimicrobiales bacterium]
MRGANGMLDRLRRLPQRLTAALRASRSGRRRPFRLRDAVIISTPVLLVALYAGAGSIIDYGNLLQFDDWWSNSARLPQLFSARLQAPLKAPRAVLLSQHLDYGAADAPIVHLRLPRDEWRAFQQDRQGSWGTWLEGELLREDGVQSVRIRRRGDTSVHWTTAKLTFTLRTPRSDLYQGFRSLAFSVKDVLSQYVAATLATDFDVLAPASGIAPVFVNGRFYGLYRITEPVDEGLVRHVGHMPGNVFQGDAAERGDTYKGVPRGLFVNPYIWNLASANTRPAAPGSSALEQFIRAINGTTFDDHVALMRWLDRAELARFIALMLVAGDLYHMDNLHNQFWYEDPWSGRLHPIVWDLRLLDLARPPLWVNGFLQAVLRDPFLVDAALGEAYRAVQHDSIPRRGATIARQAYERYRPYFEYEQLREPSIAAVGKPSEVAHVLRRNGVLLRAWAGDARVAFAIAQHDSLAVVDLESRGYAGADFTGVRLPAAAGALPRLFADLNLNGELDAGDRAIPVSWVDTPAGRELRLDTAEPLLPGWNTRGRGLRPGQVHYRLFLVGQAALAGAEPVLRNRLTGQAATVEPWGAVEGSQRSDSWNPWEYPVTRGRTHRWSGAVELDATTRIAATDTLRIEPGTVIRLAPDVSLIARGPVFARGTPQQPIRFEPAEPGRPWGAFALQGANANGSRLEQVRFTGGGGATVDRIEYSGMTNVHWARDVVFTRAEFQDNLRSDDTFHAMHADVVLEQCSFARANGDAIDYDYSAGAIRDCRFDESGNDAIDLMTSSPAVIGNVITRSDDKGISIGERSHPFVFNNHISLSERGIEVKDRSEPVLLNNVITGNRIGILQNVKNWRYGGGGWAKLIGTLVAGNEQDFLSDAASRISRTPDTGPVDPTADAYAWVYAHYGVRAGSDAPRGLLTSWNRAAPLPPVIDMTFAEDLHSTRDGWVPDRGVTQLEKRDDALVASFEKFRGSFGRAIDWEVAAAGRALLVLELATRGVDSLQLRLESDQGEVIRPLPATDSLQIFRLEAVRVPPGSYDRITIRVWPRPERAYVATQSGFVELRSARVDVRSIRLYRLPAGREDRDHVASAR